MFLECMRRLALAIVFSCVLVCAIWRFWVVAMILLLARCSMGLPNRTGLLWRLVLACQDAWMPLAIDAGACACPSYRRM